VNNTKLFNHAVIAASSKDSQLSLGSCPRNRDAKVLRTSDGEDLGTVMGCSGGGSRLWWWPSSSEVDPSMADCRARGVSHSFGIAFSMNGMHELTYARRFIQLGSSLPHRICNRKTASPSNTISNTVNLTWFYAVLTYCHYNGVACTSSVVMVFPYASQLKRQCSFAEICLVFTDCQIKNNTAEC